MEPHVVTEMWIVIEFRIIAIGGASTLHITPKDMDDAVLQFFGDVREVHVVPAVGGTLDLELVAVVLVEALETFDEEEVDGQPCSMCEMLGEVR